MCFVTGGVVSSLGKGHRRRFSRRDPRIARHPRHQHQAGSRTSTSIRARCRRSSTARCSSPRTAPRPTSTSATTSASSRSKMRRWNNFTTGQIYESVIKKERTRRLPRRHGAGDPAHHRRDQGSTSSAARATPTWRSSRSAARWATSSRCRSSRRSGRWAWSSAATTSATST